MFQGIVADPESSRLALLRPDWAPVPGVVAAMSLREGGVSQGAWASLNLGAAVGDADSAVQANRARYSAALGAVPVWLRQVHGVQVLRLGAEHRAGGPVQAAADAAWTTERGLACSVLVADCLPVLLALRDGSAVAAAHAGWRGLAGGVIEATVAVLCAGTGAAPQAIQAWLGPCIGPHQFEVGADVLQAFGASVQSDPSGPQNRFRPRPRPDGNPRWLADLAGLAHDRLAALGVERISSCGACTVESPSRFFSFRRDGVTGRHAAAIWRL